MAGGKEIRDKIKSVESTRKITRAMEMVATSKMRKAQERMRAARPYSTKIRNIAGHLSEANPDYSHPFLVKRNELKRAGFIVVTTDKGLCGAMNTNILRVVMQKLREFEGKGVGSDMVAIGSRGLGFLNRIGARVVAQVVQLGDTPHLERMTGPIKVLLDSYQNGEVDVVYLCYTKFINSMSQEPVTEQLLPLGPDKVKADRGAHSWDYIYEPDAADVIDELLVRYVEALIYHAVAENLASEHSARRVAMKAASDNAGSVIDDLKLVYNKTRQAAITKELSEIVSGAAAV
ncbi:MAG: F0F1 ATP synthase subunit gamma [Massilia sp.]|nr:MAG: F0F1 ATP synthase subunit gamma [Massilia sp.]